MHRGKRAIYLVNTDARPGYMTDSQGYVNIQELAMFVAGLLNVQVSNKRLDIYVYRHVDLTTEAYVFTLL